MFSFPYIFHVLGGNLPFGAVPLIVLLVLVEVAWLFTSVKSETHTRKRTIKGTIWIALVWAIIYLVLIILFPAPPMPVRLAVYPLAGNEQPVGMGHQLAAELEESIAATHPRWVTGSFQRLGKVLKASASIPPEDAKLLPLIKVDWLVCGSWVCESPEQMQFNLKIVRVGKRDTVSIQANGDCNTAVRDAATKIADITGMDRNPATIAPLSKEWRIACARSRVVAVYDSTQSVLFRNALKSDEKSLGGITLLINYFIDHPGQDTLLLHVVPTAEKLIKIGDKYPPFLLALGSWHRNTGDKKNAASAWLHALILSPVRPEVHFLLGHLDSSLVANKFEKSPKEHLQRAVEIDPGYVDARMRLLSMIPLNTLVHEYENLVEDGLKINPTSFPLLSRRAHYLIIYGKQPEAIQTLNQMLVVQPENATLFYNRGIAYLQGGDTTAATADFYKSWSLHGTVENLYYLGVIYESHEQWDSAIYYYQTRYKFADKSDDALATAHARVRLLKLLDEHARFPSTKSSKVK